VEVAERQGRVAVLGESEGVAGVSPSSTTARNARHVDSRNSSPITSSSRRSAARPAPSAPGPSGRPTAGIG
jgi:hypothetical protein